MTADFQDKVQPLISIGIPTFNRPDGLARVLDDILSQTYKNIEIIISDNASTDETVSSIIEKYAKNDKRIRFFIQEQNIGAVKNFEFVLAKSNGKYFTWMADDDLCKPDFLRVLVDCLENDDQLVLVMSDVGVIDQSDVVTRIEQLSEIRLVENSWKDTQRLFFSYPIGNLFFCIYGLYRASAIKKCNIAISSWKGYLFSAELPLLAQVATLGRVASVPEVLKFYRSHPESGFIVESARVTRLDLVFRELQVRFQVLKIILASDLSIARRCLLAFWSISDLVKMIVMKIFELPARIIGKIRRWYSVSR